MLFGVQCLKPAAYGKGLAFSFYKVLCFESSFRTLAVASFRQAVIFECSLYLEFFQMGRRSFPKQ